MSIRAFAPLIAVALAACGSLSAKAPLFTTADQTEPAPIQEGLWIAIGETCPASMLEAATYPGDCMPVEIRRTADGAWLLTPRDDLESDRAPNEERSRPSRMILAPFSDDGGQPLYVVELRPAQPGPDEDMSYAMIAPREAAPAALLRAARHQLRRRRARGRRDRGPYHHLCGIRRWGAGAR